MIINLTSQSLCFISATVFFLQQLLLFPGQPFPILGRLFIGPLLVFHGYVDPAVFGSGVSFAARDTVVRLDGDFEVESQKMAPQLLAIGHFFVTPGTLDPRLHHVRPLDVSVELVLERKDLAALDTLEPLVSLVFWNVDRLFIVVFPDEVVLQASLIPVLCPTDGAYDLGLGGSPVVLFHVEVQPSLAGEPSTAVLARERPLAHMHSLHVSPQQQGRLFAQATYVALCLPSKFFRVHQLKVRVHDGSVDSLKGAGFDKAGVLFKGLCDNVVFLQLVLGHTLQGFGLVVTADVALVPLALVVVADMTIQVLQLGELFVAKATQPLIVVRH